MKKAIIIGTVFGLACGLAFAQPDMGHDEPLTDPGEIANAVDDVGALNWIIAILGWSLYVLFDWQKHKREYTYFTQYFSEFKISLISSFICVPFLLFIGSDYMPMTKLAAGGIGLAGSYIAKSIQQLFINRATAKERE